MNMIRVAVAALFGMIALPAFAADKPKHIEPVHYKVVVGLPNSQIATIDVTGSKAVTVDSPDGGTIKVAGSGPLQWAGEKSAELTAAISKGKGTPTTRTHIDVAYTPKGKSTLSGKATLCGEKGSQLFVSFGGQSQADLCAVN